MTRIPKNVQRGADLLDDRLPGWRKRVNPNHLDLGNTCNCVLGQTLGDYGEAVELLGLTQAESRKFGFTTFGHQSFDSLTKAWRRLLES